MIIKETSRGISVDASLVSDNTRLDIAVPLAVHEEKCGEKEDDELVRCVSRDLWYSCCLRLAPAYA